MDSKQNEANLNHLNIPSETLAFLRKRAAELKKEKPITDLAYVGRKWRIFDYFRCKVIALVNFMKGN